MYLDIMCHCCESIVCCKATYISRKAAFEGLKLLKTARQFLAQKSIQYFDIIAQASVLGGCAINLSPCTLPHEMSYRITIKYDVPHGATVAMIEAAYMRFTA